MPAFLVLGFAALAGYAGAATDPASADGAAAPVTLAELGKPGCAPGFLRGAYYCCVGARDLANHRGASGVEMLRLAASWSSKPAQSTLGVGYSNGDIAARDRARGLAWLGLAAERRDPYYLAALRTALQQATPVEQAQANALWKAMLPTYGDARAARRAERRYQHERDRLLDLQTAGRRVCIAGLTQRDMMPIPQPVAGTVLWAFQLSIGCPGGAPVGTVIHYRDGFAGSLFDGLQGHVTVGLPSPARDGAKP